MRNSGRIKSADVKEILNESDTNESEKKSSQYVVSPNNNNDQSIPMKYIYYKVDENGDEHTMDTISLSLYQHNKTLKSKIIKDILAPTYIAEIKDTIHERKVCKITADVFLTLSKIATLFSTIFAFAASTYDHKFLSFTAGIIGCIAGAFLQFYHFAKGERKNKAMYENTLLSNLGISNFILDADKNNDFNNNENENDKITDTVKKKTYYKNKQDEPDNNDNDIDNSEHKIDDPV